MNTVDALTFVKHFADRAHGAQVRKYTGERYIVHPARVMETVREYNPDVRVLAAALLHDVLEDTPVNAHQIESALLEVMDASDASWVVERVIELTDIFIKKDFPRVNRRTRKQREVVRLSSISAEAQTIKYSDIIDNVTDIMKQDTDFARVFVHEAKAMLNAMTAGDARLRDRAVSVVDGALRKLPKSATTA
ncbi:MAG TPA: HD domain-containing protein [Chryseosolibacter sp.]|nr:HD domain-containing protein [Chryseosolibacter sp.]